MPLDGQVQVDTLADAPGRDGWTPALHEAWRALDEGRYTAAISQYSALVGGGSEEATDALWGPAEAYDASGQQDLTTRAYPLFAGVDGRRAVGGVDAVGGREREADQRGQEHTATNKG